MDLASLRNVELQLPGPLLERCVASFVAEPTRGVTVTVYGPDFALTGIPTVVQHVAGETYVALYARETDSLAFVSVARISALALHNPLAHFDLISGGRLADALIEDAPSGLALRRAAKDLEPLLGGGRPFAVTLSVSAGAREGARYNLGRVLSALVDRFPALVKEPLFATAWANIGSVEFSDFDGRTLEATRQGGALRVQVPRQYAIPDPRPELETALSRVL